MKGKVHDYKLCKRWPPAFWYSELTSKLLELESVRLCIIQSRSKVKAKLVTVLRVSLCRQVVISSLAVGLPT